LDFDLHEVSVVPIGANRNTEVPSAKARRGFGPDDPIIALMELDTLVAP